MRTIKLCLRGMIITSMLLVRQSGISAVDTGPLSAEGVIPLVVDTTVDFNEAAYQACSKAPEDCSLRGAISKVNADPVQEYTVQCLNMYMNWR